MGEVLDSKGLFGYLEGNETMRCPNCKGMKLVSYDRESGYMFCDVRIAFGVMRIDKVRLLFKSSVNGWE